MKDTPLSNSERDFLLKAIGDKKVRCFSAVVQEEQEVTEEMEMDLMQEETLRNSTNLHVSLQRLDGRQTYDYRRIKISFGADYGCCFVELGETR